MPLNQTPELGAVESVLDAMLKSENASEFCRSLVHSDFMGDTTQGKGAAGKQQVGRFHRGFP